MDYQKFRESVRSVVYIVCPFIMTTSNQKLLVGHAFNYCVQTAMKIKHAQTSAGSTSFIGRCTQNDALRQADVCLLEKSNQNTGALVGKQHGHGRSQSKAVKRQLQVDHLRNGVEFVASCCAVVGMAHTHPINYATNVGG